MKIINILQKILMEQTVEPIEPEKIDITAPASSTYVATQGEPKIAIDLDDEQKVDFNKDNLDSVISCSGYGPNTSEFKLAKIIANKEGWVKNMNNGKGSRSYRNNNPGNLDYYDGLKSIDSKATKETKLDGSTGRFAKFSSPCLGAKALIEEKIIKWSNGNMPDYGSAPGYDKGEIPTLKQFMYTYAPPNENDTTKYINDILKSLGNAEFTPDTSMAKIIKI
jgi:hypothetical protein